MSRPWWVIRPRFLAVIALVYLFLVAIELLGGSFKAVGRDTAQQLIAGVTNPFAGLAVGILATVLVQSSSVTTATVVGLVGSGQVPLDVAIPMIMGANIGTTITNTLVSMGHITRSEEFRRAFAGATVHDFFNLITVAIVFPLELSTGFLQRTATTMAESLTPSEFRLLDVMIRRPGRAFSRSELMYAALGEDTPGSDRTIDVHIRALRQKLGDFAAPIQTVRGVGYRFRDESG